MEKNIEKKWILIGGAPRSGTTLLCFLLNSHTNIYITNEHNLNEILNSLKNVYTKEIEFNKSFLLFEREKGIKENWKNNEVLNQTLQKSFSLKRLFETLYYENCLGIYGKEAFIFGDKMPRYYLNDYSRFRNEIYKLKIIHISRHPIDVINSMMVRAKNKINNKDTWSLTHTIEEALNEWILAWNFIVENFDEHILHVKYEDLCLFNSDKTINEISKFIDVNNSFNLELINNDVDNHFIRKEIKESEIKILYGYLGGIINDWNNYSLKELIDKYGVFSVVKLKKKSKFKWLLKW